MEPESMRNASTTHCQPERLVLTRDLRGAERASSRPRARLMRAWFCAVGPQVRREARRLASRDILADARAHREEIRADLRPQIEALPDGVPIPDHLVRLHGMWKRADE